MAVDHECNQAYQQARLAAEAATIALNLSHSPLVAELKDLGGKIPLTDGDTATSAEKAAGSEIRREFIRRMKRIEEIATGGKSLKTLAEQARAVAKEADKTATALETAAGEKPKASKHS